MTNSDEEVDEQYKFERMSMNCTNWQRRTIPLTQTEIANLKNMFNKITNVLTSMTSLIYIAMISFWIQCMQ